MGGARRRSEFESCLLRNVGVNTADTEPLHHASRNGFFEVAEVFDAIPSADGNAANNINNGLAPHSSRFG